MLSRRRKSVLMFLILTIGSINAFSFIILSDTHVYIAKYILSVIFYLIVVYILWIENDSLEIFHFDRLTLWLVALSGSIFHKKLGIPNEPFFQIILGILSIAIFIAIFKYRSKIPRTKAKWAIFGLVVGILISLIIIRIEFLIQQLVDIEVFSPQNYRILEIASKIAYQLSYIAPLEEVLYRGILWGYLSLLGWKENRIFWVQAILFWLGHLSYIGFPFTFFIIIPIVTLQFSLLVYKSKQLAPSILTHVMINSLTTLLRA